MSIPFLPFKRTAKIMYNGFKGVDSEEENAVPQLKLLAASLVLLHEIVHWIRHFQNSTETAVTVCLLRMHDGLKK